MDNEVTGAERWPDWGTQFPSAPDIPRVFSLYPGARHEFWLSFDPGSRTRALLLGLTDVVVNLPQNLPGVRGVRIEKVSVNLPGSNGPRPALQLTLLDLGFVDVFDALVADVVWCAEQSPELQGAINEVIRRVQRWIQLLDELPSEGLSRALQIGLYGELWFVFQYLVRAWGITRAIAAWRGPQAAYQDIQDGGCAIEIKTTTAVDATDIPISNTLQLDSSPFDVLLLSHISFILAPDAGQKLPELVGALRSEARDGGCGALFEERLLSYGYQDNHSE